MTFEKGDLVKIIDPNRSGLPGSLKDCLAVVERDELEGGLQKVYRIRVYNFNMHERWAIYESGIEKI